MRTLSATDTKHTSLHQHTKNNPPTAINLRKMNSQEVSKTLMKLGEKGKESVAKAMGIRIEDLTSGLSEMKVEEKEKETGQGMSEKEKKKV